MKIKIKQNPLSLPMTKINKGVSLDFMIKFNLIN